MPTPSSRKPEPEGLNPLVEFVMIAALVAGGVIVLSLIFQAQLQRYTILAPGSQPIDTHGDDGPDA